MKIGIDMIDAERFAGMPATKLARMFTAREIEYIKSKNFAPETIAGLFAAKEAYFKALGIGVTPKQLLSIEIIYNELGAPYFSNSKDLLDDRDGKKMPATLSISHTKTTAVAVCILNV
jgi:holo-[acyl-carrier protein] synthase